MTNDRKKAEFSTWQKIISTALLLAITAAWAYNSDLNEMVASLSRFSLLSFSALFLVQLVTLAMTSYIWYRLVNIESNELSFFNAFRINSAAGFIESVTPSSKLGAEAAKVLLVKRFTNLNVQQITGLTIIKTATTLMPFLLISMMVISVSLFYFRIPAEVRYALILTLLLCVVTASVLLKRKPMEVKPVSAKRFLMPFSILNRKLISGCNYCRTAVCMSRCIARKKDLCLLSMVSLTEWVLYPLKVFIVASILEIQAPLLLIFLATYSAYCVSLLPLTPGGLGTFEASMALVLSLNGIPFHSGMLLAVTGRVITFWVPLLISFLSSLSISVSSKVPTSRLLNAAQTNR